DLITIGVIKKAHGINGYVHVHPLTYDPNRFFALKRVYLNDKRKTELKIEDIKQSGKSLIVKFRNCDNRLAADALKSLELMVPETEKIKLPSDVYFIHDLIDCTVFDSSGQQIGIVIDVQENGGNDLYVVQRSDLTEVLIPAVSQFIKSIEIELKKIEISEIPGLLD
ncbi:MAG: 16S rRNA processing protein RimM, partial [Calditrichaeota bacterium]|nr:16S rRNA processing protein RimM [Calditrichota bacterium]